MSDAELRKKLDSDRSFVYLKRQVEQETDKIVKLGIPASRPARNTSASTPRAR
jgi:hypothetical protein